MTDSHRESLHDFEMHDDFVRRHNGPQQHDVEDMLKVVGVSSLDELIDRNIPKSIRTSRPLNLPPVRSERAALSHLRRMAARNRVMVSMIGMGYYGSVMPPVILRNVLEDPGWYTAYTPYQSEISQGRMEMLLNYQQMIIDMTGMEISNAALLDEGTAAAEAMTMSHRVSRKKKATLFFVDEGVLPQTLAVIKTRADFLGFEVVVGNPFTDMPDLENIFGVILQYPCCNGEVRDLRPVIEKAHAANVLVTVAADLLALAILTPPGEMGADIVVGSNHRFGLPIGFGGPHAGYFATRDAYKRQMPGRLIGVSIDSTGHPALRMALQTREQHIRREKATSNICTSSVLLAVLSTFYAMYHGADGLRRIANRIHRMTLILAEGLRRSGYTIRNGAFFDTLIVETSSCAERIAARARESGINLWIVDANHVGISLDETTRKRNLRTLWDVFKTGSAESLSIEVLDTKVKSSIPENLRRTSDFLTNPAFQRYHSETEMMRYIRRMRDKDIALNRSMIPLGSCTLKLNATSEMLPVTWREFARMHPFAPEDQTQGYQQLFEELEQALCEITGYDAVSFQPNSGAQGEYAGLVAIRKYHEAQGEGHRNICLIPASAHGTNPASAALAGLKVVVVKGNKRGDIDVADLRAKAEEHKDNLAALMVTYPSTHGVFEGCIREVCDIIHQNGGQVYMDGANLNAMVGLVRPGEIGSDVSHLNLHKTFAIPHGGGGPGVGPIGVKAHLAPYLPGHPAVHGLNPDRQVGQGAVSSAPWGSASILPISWAYIAMMGAEGLTRATKLAILNANYIMKRLEPHYPVLYTGESGFCAHEYVLDMRPLETATGITAEDVAKRLVDYGIHAPTMSFPVPGTLMIEPTESESKRELDRFCEAMIYIRQEIADVESGKADPKDNVLKNAPHTHGLLLEDEWPHPYSKREAFFPHASLRGDKFWPPVGRVDNVHGDRNLIYTLQDRKE